MQTSSSQELRDALNSNRYRTIGVTVPESWVPAIDDLALADCQTRSAWARRVIFDALTKLQAKIGAL